MSGNGKDEQVLVNRVAKSGLLTYDLEALYPDEEIAVLDIKDFLFKGLVLREKEFRQAMKDHDWKQYKGKILLVSCSNEAIVPRWAYMLVTMYGREHAGQVNYATKKEYLRRYYLDKIADLSLDQFVDRKVILKGCSDREVPTEAYVAMTEKLLPVVDSLMYGEPCSTVPIYKRKNQTT